MSNRNSTYDVDNNTTNNIIALTYVFCIDLFLFLPFPLHIINTIVCRRQKQIAEFKRLNPTAISRADGRNFQVPVTTAYSRFLLLVYADAAVVVVCKLVLNACRALPDEFPAKAPVVSVSVDNLQHPWIDRQGRVQGHPHLDNWNSHCVLGNIIRNVVSEFMSNPPRVGGDQSPAQAEPVQRQQQAASDVESNRIALSPIPEKFDELDALS